MIESFYAQLPVRIRFGAGVVGALTEVIGGRRALVVSEPPVARHRRRRGGGGGPAAVREAARRADAGARSPTPPQHVADERPEVLVAVGGGSALDLAKAARLVAGQGRADRGASWRVRRRSRSPSVDLVAVPTTSGTGSEVSGGVGGGRSRAGAQAGGGASADASPGRAGRPAADAAAAGRGDRLHRRRCAGPGDRRRDRLERQPDVAGRRASRPVVTSRAGLAAVGGRRLRRRRPHRAQPGQPDGRPGDEPVRLRR